MFSVKNPWSPVFYLADGMKRGTLTVYTEKILGPRGGLYFVFVESSEGFSPDKIFGPVVPPPPRVSPGHIRRITESLRELR